MGKHEGSLGEESYGVSSKEMFVVNVWPQISTNRL